MTYPFPPPEQPGHGNQPTQSFAAPAGYPAPYVHPAGYGHGWPGAPVHRVANPVGIVLALVGGAAVLLGGFLDWYTDTALGDIVNALDFDGAKAFPKAYFGWLMWVLLAVTVVAALFASLPTGAATAMRIVSPIVGGIGAVLVLVSLGQLIQNGSVFDHSEIGLYLTMLGFVIAGAAGIIGPRRAALR